MSFLKRDPQQPAFVHSTHPEASGLFVLKKMTIMDRVDFNRLRALFVGDLRVSQQPKEVALAEAVAYLKVGLKETPKDVVVDEITDEEFCVALAEEVKRYNASFSRPSSSKTD